VEQGARTRPGPTEPGKVGPQFKVAEGGRSAPAETGTGTEGVVTRWFRTRGSSPSGTSPQGRARGVSGGSARESSSLRSTSSIATKSGASPLAHQEALGEKPVRTIDIERFRSPVSGSDETESTADNRAEEFVEEEPDEDTEVYEEEEDDDDLESILDDLESQE
jgi:hypothetical protein